MAHYVVRIARRAGIALLFVAAAVAGTLSGLLFAASGDMPQVSSLDDYAPSTITRVYGVNGEVVGEFATQRRVVITYDQISPLLKQAIVSAEDQDFDSHLGLSLPRIVVTVIKDLLRGQRAGASTLTQQLAQEPVPHEREDAGTQGQGSAAHDSDREALHQARDLHALLQSHPLGAWHVRRRGRLRLYFGKSAKDLTLEEAAMLAGIIQAPSRQSPYVSIERATRRRNYALQRMAEEGFITEARADQAKRSPIVTAGRPSAGGFAAFYLEEVRQHLEERYGAKRLYESGLAGLHHD